MDDGRRGAWRRDSSPGSSAGRLATGPPTHHIHQRHVKEHAGRDGEDPAGDVLRVLAHRRADQHADVGHEGGQQVVDDGLLHRHPRFEQHRKVTCQPEHTVTRTPWKRRLFNFLFPIDVSPAVSSNGRNIRLLPRHPFSCGGYTCVRQRRHPRRSEAALSGNALDSRGETGGWPTFPRSAQQAAPFFFRLITTMNILTLRSHPSIRPRETGGGV